MKRLRVLLVKCGDVEPQVRASAGDYDHWFSTALEGLPVSLDLVRPYSGEALPPVGGHDAILVTGSASSVTRPVPWMTETARYLRRAIDANVPTLGVCFGHQLLGLAFGAQVIRNPQGREMGTVTIALTPEGRRDPLFAGLDEELEVQATHEDMVTPTSPEIALLATNAATVAQAIRVGATGRGVQFHPELSAHGLAALAECRREILDREGTAQGLAPGEGSRRVMKSIRSSEIGRRLLENFCAWVGASLEGQ